MSKEMVMMRSASAYALCMAVALVLGYVLATPTALTSLAVVSLTLLVLFSPLYLRWHHALLIAGWHSALILFFLPGSLELWIVLAMGSLAMAILRYTLNKQQSFIHVPSLSRPLIALTVVILVTMSAHGGLGVRALGSQLWGTKRYIWLLAAILGYFALTSEQIPRKRAKLYAALFFLSGVTAAISDLAYAGGPSFYSLFYLVSPDIATLQAITSKTLERLTGVCWAAIALCYYLLMRHGIRGLCDLRRPWRVIFFGLLVGLATFGGYRGVVILLFIVLVCQFVLEGLLRSHLFPIILLVGVLTSILLVGFVDRLPLAVQRSLSFLPLRIDRLPRQDADSTLDWRLEMWKVVIPEVPKHLFIGKGYGFDATEYYLMQEAMRRGLYSSYEDTLISGNYHNGWLTLVVPFGIPGLLSFFWFCWAALRVLHANYRNSPPGLVRINTFLLAYFVARILFYLVFYGQFDQDLQVLTGAVGFSVALNGGVLRPATAPRAPTTHPQRLIEPVAVA